MATLTCPATPTALRCEYQVNPLGLGTPHPRLFWQIRDPRRGARQMAYQIRVASQPTLLDDGKPDLWDSGKIDSDQSTHIEYAGRALRSRQRCHWQVRIWDPRKPADGQPSAWPDPQSWEMGLLKKSDWRAKWIGLKPTGDLKDSQPSPYLRKAFSSGDIAAARLYVTAKGLYEVQINGRRVSEDLFNPGWTDYNKRIQYRVYDVTDLLKSGDNVIGAILGDGWYAGHVHRGVRCYGEYPQLLVQLEITAPDGTVQTILTDETWQAATGPILSSDMFMGEHYNARVEMPGWSAPQFDAAAWKPVDVVNPLGDAALVASPGPAVHRMDTVRPIAVTEPTPGVHIFDMGQNMVGWMRFTVTGPSGATVTLRHAEMLNPDGTLYTENLRTAKQTNTYTLKGGGPETHEPRFTFQGFRYVEVTGWPAGKPCLDDFTGIVLYSDMPTTGSFECSNAEVNQLQHNIHWGQRGNFLDVPTDCPQRDERMGWMGDAQVFVGTACFNMNVAGFFTKWLDDVLDAQLPDGAFSNYSPVGPGSGPGAAAWGDAGVICPWHIYLRYGDRRVLHRCYTAMAGWIDYCQKNSASLIRPDIGYFGDWLSINAPTPNELIATAYFAYSTHLMSHIAAALGKKRDHKKYAALFSRIKRAFNREFVTRAGRVCAETQTAYVLALAFDLLDSPARPAAINHFIHNIQGPCKGHLSTGFVGIRDLQPVLTRIRRLDVAYHLLHNKQFPSWLYPITHGATTIWERWDGWTHDKGFQTPSMNSFNHYAYGSVGEWLYEAVAGIAPHPDQPGYQHVVIHPHVDPSTHTTPITWAKAHYDSIHGRIETHWRIEAGRFTLDVTIPANCTATVYLPTDSPDAARESNSPLDSVDGLSNVRTDGAEVLCQLAAGQYTFTCPAPSRT